MILSDVEGKLLHLLFPHLESVRIDDVVATDRVIRFDATACAWSAGCPVCGQPSSRVHSRYQRRLADHAVGGREVVIRCWCAPPVPAWFHCPNWTLGSSAVQGCGAQF